MFSVRSVSDPTIPQGWLVPGQYVTGIGGQDLEYFRLVRVSPQWDFPVPSDYCLTFCPLPQVTKLRLDLQTGVVTCLKGSRGQDEVVVLEPADRTREIIERKLAVLRSVR